jgi:hypothetical protein
MARASHKLGHGLCSTQQGHHFAPFNLEHSMVGCDDSMYTICDNLFHMVWTFFCIIFEHISMVGSHIHNYVT